MQVVQPALVGRLAWLAARAVRVDLMAATAVQR